MLIKDTNTAKTFKKVAGKNKWQHSCSIVTLVVAMLLLGRNGYEKMDEKSLEKESDLGCPCSIGFENLRVRS